MREKPGSRPPPIKDVFNRSTQLQSSGLASAGHPNLGISCRPCVSQRFPKRWRRHSRVDDWPALHSCSSAASPATRHLSLAPVASTATAILTHASYLESVSLWTRVFASRNRTLFPLSSLLSSLSSFTARFIFPLCPSLLSIWLLRQCLHSFCSKRAR